MGKENKKPKEKVHFSRTLVPRSEPRWKTLCGLVLDATERKEVILTWEIELTTCKSCKENYVEPDPE